MRLRLSWVLVVVGQLTLVFACGGDDDDDDASGGGAGRVGTGGSNAGGAGGTGEAGEPSAGGGAVSTPPEGGSSGEGGNRGEGGASTGGTVAEGGASMGGGSSPGGTNGDGGATMGGDGGTATGGSPTSGGSGVGGAGGGEIVLTVNPSEKGNAISPHIYGVTIDSTAPQCSNADARFGLCRLGGSRYSTHNWENNASNAGSSLCHQNDAALGASADPGLRATTLLTNAAGKASSLLTIPILDYVAADKTGGSTVPDTCPGDVRKSGTGTTYLGTRFKQNRAVKGAAFSLTPDTSDDFVNQDEFVNFVRDRAAGAPVMFALDYQPSLWDLSHPESYLTNPTYADVVARNIAYATMVRATWPEAKVLGYGGYGWNDFVNLQDAPDAAGKGEFVDFYLSSLQAAATSASTRLVDYLDIHWYPELYVVEGRITGAVATPEARRIRVQAPRSLWDTTYSEQSWISVSALGGGPIRLIPRMKGKIDAHYPGTGLAISEWTYGGENDISGAVAASDALGVFGREGVALAAFKAFSATPTFVIGAFAAFRNFDGAGASFGDTSVSASSSDVSRVSVYASTDSATPGRVVIVIVNRAEDTTLSSLRIEDAASFSGAQLYQLTSAAPLPSAQGALTASAVNTFDLELPGYSVSVLVPTP